MTVLRCVGHIAREIVLAHILSASRRRAVIVMAIVVLGFCFSVVAVDNGMAPADAVGVATRALAALVFTTAVGVTTRLTLRWTDVGRAATVIHAQLAFGLSLAVVRVFGSWTLVDVLTLINTLGFVWWGVCLADGLYARLRAIAGVAADWKSNLTLLGEVADDLRAEGLLDHAERIDAVVTGLTVEGTS